jgi:DNA-binding NarL/FixJ family response regulator
METPQDSYRVMLVENDGATIQGVRWALEEDPQFVFLGYISSKAQVGGFLDEHVPNVALVDVGLMRPGAGLLSRQEIQCLDEGLEVIALIKQVSTVTRVIGFSNYFIDNAPLVKSALSRGADALIAKQSGPHDWKAWGEWLRYQIRSVIGDCWQMSPEVARLIEEEEQNRRTYQPDAPWPLTERQMEVVHWLAVGCSDQQIADQLFITSGAVRGHVSNIKERLHMQYRWQVIEEARKRGMGNRAAPD